jgi:nitronate monooxygenase
MAQDAPAFPLGASFALPLRGKAEAAGSGEFSPLWSGQAGPLARPMPAGELTRRLAEEAATRLKSLAG